MSETANYSIVHVASRVVDVAGSHIVEALVSEGVGDVSPAHGDILAVLFASGAVSVSELSRRTRRSKSTVSVLVDKLVAKGYIEKARSASDSRAVTVALTEKGEALRPVFAKVSLGLDMRIEKALGSEKAAELEKLLKELLEKF